MSTESLLLFMLAGLVLNLTPGPDVLYIVSNALRQGARSGVVAALGITAGCFVHIVAATVGVSALLAASSLAFTVLKWLGAAYLVYVGCRLLRSRGPVAMDLEADYAYLSRASAEFSAQAVFLRGFWTNALNPKVALFFLAFLPQFIGPQVEHKSLAFLGLGLLFTFNGLWVNIGWGLAAAWLASRAGLVNRSMYWLDKAAGVLFIGFGIKLALTAAPSTT
ncbi:LysE family translocator [Curvibacter sp. APW13]|uniref:LysE family translocator n=1 Tax=Curvibacter sp. APW13 TaxID=3077236 RepID=UPI0028DD9C31|nr:LysE family translocator [Curvibacter sp. APW13]MDT8990865.1 LysE family translocator [Curvibacter sp. APW13]